VAGNGLCFCGSMRRHKKCHPDISENSLAALMLSLYARADKLIDNHYAERKTKPLCKKGCGDCCSILFNVSILEFIIICREMKKWEPKKISQIKRKVLRGMTYIRDQHPVLYNFLRSDHSNQDFAEMTYKNYQLSKNIELNCPFLTELPSRTRICSIYKVRPLLCRIFGTSYYVNIENMYVCSRIGTNKVIMEYGPSTEDIWKSFVQDILTVDYYGKCYRGNIYPLIYWLFLAISCLDNLKEYLGGERNYRYFQEPYKDAKAKILLNNM